MSTVTDLLPMRVRGMNALFRSRGVIPQIERREDGVIVAEVNDGPWRMVVHFHGRRGRVRHVELHKHGEAIDVNSIAEAVLIMLDGAQVPGEGRGLAVDRPASAKRSNSVETRRATVRRV